MKKAISLLFIFSLMAALVYGQKDEILKLKEKIVELQNKGELGFRNFTLCSNIIGFASYVPLAEAVVKKGGELLIYYEPVNIYTGKREGLYEIWYTQDMVLMKMNGEVIQEWKDILNFHYTTKTPVMDLFATNSIELATLPAGQYKFQATIKDKLRNKQTSKTIEFRIK